MLNKFVHLTKFHQLALVFAIGFLIAGCGQKGPLKLPKEEKVELPSITNIEEAISIDTSDETIDSLVGDESIYEKPDTKETKTKENSNEKQN